MKALLICPQCGYQIIGHDPKADEALKAAIAGMEHHRELQHGVPLTPDSFITALRIGKVH